MPAVSSQLIGPVVGELDIFIGKPKVGLSRLRGCGLGFKWYIAGLVRHTRTIVLFLRGGIADLSRWCYAQQHTFDKHKQRLSNRADTVLRTIAEVRKTWLHKNGAVDNIAGVGMIMLLKFSFPTYKHGDGTGRCEPKEADRSNR